MFEYYIDTKTRTWTSWESKLSAAYKPAPDMPFFKIMVPTVDTVRNKFVASALVKVFQHTLIVGNVGVGKTMIVQSLLDSLPADRSQMVINFSAQTSSNSLQVGGWGVGGGGLPWGASADACLPACPPARPPARLPAWFASVPSHRRIVSAGACLSACLPACLPAHLPVPPARPPARL